MSLINSLWSPPVLLCWASVYLLGSIPTGALVARLHGGVDLTKVGSQRTGATNALRTMGVGAGVAVLVGDFLKGGVAVWIAMQIIGDPLGVGIAALVTVIGHIHSVFLRFRGGRGVATGMGTLAVLSPQVFVVALLAGIAAIAATRYVSLGSICGCAAALLAGLGLQATTMGEPGFIPYFILGPVLVIAAHSDNLGRLRAGTERRLGTK